MNNLNQPSVINTATHPNYRREPNPNLLREIHAEEALFRKQDKDKYINDKFSKYGITDYWDKSAILSSSELYPYINARDDKMIKIFLDTFAIFRFDKEQ